jgi:hypothetical protein
MQRLITPDGTEGPSTHSFQPASFQIRWSSMHVVMPRGLRCGASAPCLQHFPQDLRNSNVVPGPKPDAHGALLAPPANPIHHEG